jgi:hypothetical protein
MTVSMEMAMSMAMAMDGGAMEAKRVSAGLNVWGPRYVRAKNRNSTTDNT